MNRINNILNTNFAYRRNIYGKNVCIAILDTGISPHIDFIQPTKRILAFIDFINHRRNPYDDCGHGTHVAGIIAGSGFNSNGVYHGIAPKTNLVILKILDHNGNGNINNVIKAIHWVISNKSKYNIKILNISLGTITDNPKENQILVQSVENAWNNGITVLTAAGNLGPDPYSVTAPGTSKKIITVGSSEEYLHSISNGNINYSYSGCGPTKECILKPEIVAPGNNIISCINSTKGYISKSGTSMSTPIVSGSIALLYEKYPYLTNKDIKILLYKTALDINLPKNKQGWGMINIPALLN